MNKPIKLTPKQQTADDELRNCRMEFRFSPTEIETISEAAESYGTTLSDFVRYFSTLQAKYILANNKCPRIINQ